MGGGSLLAAYSAAGMASNTPPVTRDESEPLSDSKALGTSKVRTLNGWTLPYRLNGDVKEFHLVAEPVEHEFAPGTRATCWGYNGSTPGPTIEAVEGDRCLLYTSDAADE